MTLPTLIDIPRGQIFVKDEGTRRHWQVGVEEFQLASTPVTTSFWNEVTGDTKEAPSNTPVVDVAWSDATYFCNTLSKLHGLTPAYTLLDDHEAEPVLGANGFRLPTEAEWEYACRAGSNAERYGDLDAIAWFADNSQDQIHDVGQKTPNAWGLHDMIGNSWEWCWDLFDGTKYGRYRVFRGGGWSDIPRACRASCRRKSHPSFRIDDLSFRLARSL